MDNSFDIMIIGGGVAGCIAAMHLHHYYKVLVIEKTEGTNTLNGETLVASSRRIFSELGIDLENLMKDPKISRKSVGIQSYWGTTNPSIQDSLTNPEGNSWSIDKNNFVLELQNITQERGIKIVREDIINVVEESQQWTITSRSKNDSKNNYQAKFIIDASGRRGIIEQKTDFKRQIKDKLIGINATINIPTEKELSIPSNYLVENIWSHYEYHHYIYYNTEQRWGNEVFWKRRQNIN